MIGKLIIGIFVVVIGFVIGWYFTGGKKSSNTITDLFDKTQSTTPKPDNVSAEYTFTEEVPTDTYTTVGPEKGGVNNNDAIKNTNQINYTDSGFNPMTITIKVNTPVKFSNKSSNKLWVKSNDPDLKDLDQKKASVENDEYTYVFSKVGTWKYFNREKSDKTGIVVVVQ